ncbi:Chlorovirus glycoprotein repeat domain-containing protein [Paramecium bursaria Chlorella virus CVM-1]|nr:Chlorovirus glycoprotein repeat domain-containing protein [Paramecium bursaria Chlorella virus CVM-1]
MYPLTTSSVTVPSLPVSFTSSPQTLTVVDVLASNAITTADIFVSNAVSAVEVIATGNVSADYFLGNGALLTGIVTDVSGNLMVDSVVASGNVSADHFIGNGAELTGVLHVIPTDLDVVDVLASNAITTADIFVSNAITVAEVIATGNVSADYFLGNGALLTGIVTDVSGNLTVDSVVASGNVTAEYLLGNGSLLTGVLTDVSGNLSVDSLVAIGNVTAEYLIGNGSLLTDVIPADLNVDNVVATSAITAPQMFAGTINAESRLTAFDVSASNSMYTANVFVSGNVEAAFFVGNGAFLTGIVTDVSGNLTVDSVVASGNVSADHFIGNGSELTGVLHTIPTDLDVVDVFASNAITTADIFVSNAAHAVSFIGDGSLLTNVLHEIPVDLTVTSLTATGYVTAPDMTVDNGILTFDIKASNSSYATESFASNVTATNYFFGNGVYLTDVLHEIPLDLNVNNVNALVNIETSNLNALRAQIDTSLIVGNAVTANVFLGDGSQLGGIVALNGEGKIAQTDLDGFLVVPQGYTANTATRLALGGGGLPVGSLVRQVDSNVSYMLSTTPSNVDINWFVFTGLNFPVNTVFGRVGDVQSSFGDYFDDYIELSANVGPVQTGNSVSAALAYLAGQISALSAFVGF